MANFEAFSWNISSSANLLFLKSVVLHMYYVVCYSCHENSTHRWRNREKSILGVPLRHSPIATTTNLVQHISIEEWQLIMIRRTIGSIIIYLLWLPFQKVDDDKEASLIFSSNWPLLCCFFSHTPVSKLVCSSTVCQSTKKWQIN